MKRPLSITLTTPPGVPTAVGGVAARLCPRDIPARPRCQAGPDRPQRSLEMAADLGQRVPAGPEWRSLK